MNVTKRRHPTGWQVVINGRPSELFIRKGNPPRYRERQMYCVMNGAGDGFLFEARSVSAAISIIATVLAAQSPTPTDQQGA